MRQNLLQNRISIKSELKSFLKEISEVLKFDVDSQEKLLSISAKLDTSQNKCFQALDLVQMGAICVLSSGKGALHSEVKDEELILQVL